jgi:hypothetical protein
MLAAGVKNSMPAELTAGATEKSAAFSMVQVTVNASVSVSPGPADTSVAHCRVYAPESSATGMVAGPAVKVGGSFTAARQVTSSNQCQQHSLTKSCCVHFANNNIGHLGQA